MISLYVFHDAEKLAGQPIKLVRMRVRLVRVMAQLRSEHLRDIVVRKSEQ
jgi:hypothetical protein